MVVYFKRIWWILRNWFLLCTNGNHYGLNSIWEHKPFRIYQNVSGPILKYWKIYMVAPTALGTKYETSHTPLFLQKLYFPSHFSRPLVIIFSTKGFLTIIIVQQFFVYHMKFCRKLMMSVYWVCAVWPPAQQGMVGRICQCKKLAKYGCRVTAM